MNLFLAGNAPWRKSGLYDQIINGGGLLVLESFYYCDSWVEKSIPRFEKFMLDSGAFTFFSSGKQVDWDKYVDRY